MRKLEHKTKDLTVKKYSGEHDECDCLNMRFLLCHCPEESIFCGFNMFCFLEVVLEIPVTVGGRESQSGGKKSVDFLLERVAGLGCLC